MDDIPEEQGQELYKKLNSEYLIECGEKKIDEWNDLYLEYLELEWNRLYPKRDWDLKNVFELVKRDSQLKRPDFHGEDFREAISRGVRFARAHLEGAEFIQAHLEGANFLGAKLEGANFLGAQLDGANFLGAQLDGANFFDTQLEGTIFLGAHLDGADFSEVHLEGADFSDTLFDVAHMDGADFSEVHLEKADCSEILFDVAHMKGAKFTKAHLEGAKFEKVHLEGADFLMAHLEGAKFTKAHLKGADFLMAHLEGAIFMETHLEGATFEYAIMDGKTMFIENSIDKKTNFMGTALSATRIDPNLRTKLERNIREIQWRKWYNKPKISPWRFLKKSFGKKEETEEEQECKSSLTDRVFINPFVRLFWWLSDYGTSCKRCLASFVGLILFAFVVNFVLTQYMSPDVAELFANTVLALFGVGNPGLEGIARLWQVIYVISGYFLLSVLIARFAIMFQNMSP